MPGATSNDGHAPDAALLEEAETPATSEADEAAGGTRLVRNTSANAILFAVQLATNLVSFPYVLNHFGPTAYGVYSVLLGLQVFLQLLTFGISSSLMRFVPRARNDAAAMQSLLDNAYFFALASNTLIAVILVGLAAGATPLLGIAPSQHGLYFQLTLALAVTTVANGWLSVPRGVLAGFERFGQRTRLEMIGAVGPLLGVAFIAVTGATLPAYVWFTQGAFVLSGALVARASRKLTPGTRHRPLLHRATVRDLAGFNVLLMANQVADLLFYTSDRLVLQRVRGSATVADYAVVDRPNTLAQSLLSLPLTAIIPAAARAHALRDHYRLNALARTGTRVYTALILPPLLILMVLMKEFLRYWVGQPYEHLATNAQLFVLALALTTPAKVVSHILLAMGLQRPVVVSKIGYAPFNLLLSIVLARRVGMIGVIIPTLLYYALIYPIALCRMMRGAGISPNKLARDSAPVVVTAIAAAAVTSSLNAALHPRAFVVFAALAVVALVVSYAAVTAIGLDADDRAHLLRALPGPVRRIAQGRQARHTPVADGADNRLEAGS